MVVQQSGTLIFTDRIDHQTEAESDHCKVRKQLKMRKLQFLLFKVTFLLLQAYAMMLSLSENNSLHAPSQNSLDAWLSMGGGPSETSSFHPLNHI